MRSKWPEDYHWKSKGPITIWNKLNVFWWFGNRDDPVEENDWYLTEPVTRMLDHLVGAEQVTYHPLWYRKIRWGIRNPLCNFNRYCIGFWDKKHILNDTQQWPNPGQRFTIRPPFLCRRGKRWECYLGWKPRQGAEFGWAFRKARSR